MNKLTAEMAEALLDEIGWWGGEATIREGYSGRGMYGREVVAFVVDEQPAGFLVAMGYALATLQREELEQDEVEIVWGDLEPDDLPTEMDNMGLGTVIY